MTRRPDSVRVPPCASCPAPISSEPSLSQQRLGPSESLGGRRREPCADHFGTPDPTQATQASVPRRSTRTDFCEDCSVLRRIRRHRRRPTGRARVPRDLWVMMVIYPIQLITTVQISISIQYINSKWRQSEATRLLHTRTRRYGHGQTLLQINSSINNGQRQSRPPRRPVRCRFAKANPMRASSARLAARPCRICLPAVRRLHHEAEGTHPNQRAVVAYSDALLPS